MPASLPLGFALYQLSVGHYVSRALNVAVELELAEQLEGGPRDCRELARAVEAHAPSLRRVMRLLASVGVFEELDDERFGLTPLADLLRAGAEGSMQSMVKLMTGIGIQDSWKELEYCVRTGQPAFRKLSPDADPFTQMSQDPEAAAVFDKAMATFAPQMAAAVAAAYDFSVFERIADVGGGNGAILCGLLKANPKLTGFVFDQPHVVERAKSHVEAQGMADRCKLVGGSFFESIPSGADAYLLKHVIHDWDDEKSAVILRNCREALPPNGKVLIIEGVYPARIDTSIGSRGAAANDVNMLVVAGGRQRSEDEFRELYAASGLRLTRIIPTLAPVAVVEGERAE